MSIGRSPAGSAAVQPHCVVQSKWRRMSYSTLQLHSCWKILPQDLDSLKYIEISIFFMLWLQISMLAINYIYTPIKCNHCILGEENYRYSSFFLFICGHFYSSLGIILYGRPTVGQLLPFSPVAHLLSRLWALSCRSHILVPLGETNGPASHVETQSTHWFNEPAVP